MGMGKRENKMKRRNGEAEKMEVSKIVSERWINESRSHFHENGFKYCGGNIPCNFCCCLSI
jgi:hypothetical protein